MKISIVKMSLVIDLLLSGVLMAQAPDVLWTRSYGFQEYDWAAGAFELPSGNFIVGGHTQDTSSYDYRGWIFKVDSQGNMISEHHTGYYNLDEQIYCMRPAANYSFVYTGTAEHPDGNVELYAVRTDSNGVMTGGNRLGGDHNHIGNGVIELPSGQCVFVGELQTTPHQGLLNWTFPDLSFMFQNAYDMGEWLDLYSIDLTLDSALVVVGKIQPNPFESWFYFLMKLNSLAECIGNRIYGFGGDDQIPYWVTTTPDSGYVICGYTTQDNNLNVRAMYIVKVDPYLNEEWTKKYLQSEGRVIINHPDGGYVVAGNDRGPGGLKILVMRLDENGDSLWTKKVPGAVATSISRTADGGYIVSGATPYSTDRKTDAFLVRLGPESVSIGDEVKNKMPSHFNLVQNYPNPFNSKTHIQYEIKQTSVIQKINVQLKVFDELGREVATLVDEYKSPGQYEVEYDTANLPSGVFYYRLQVGESAQTRKMVLLK